MKKLIEVTQINIIECDNPDCGYHIPSTTGDPNEDITMYVNMPCPSFGDNLLTEQDYILAQKTRKAINWINRRFSWLTIFRPLMFWAKEKTYVLTQHEKATIKEITPNEGH